MSMSQPAADNAGLFGCDFNDDDQLVIIGVPWEPTVSYGRGTSKTPTAIVEPSHQLDFFDIDLGEEFGEQVGMLPIDPRWQALNQESIALAEPIIAAGGATNESLRQNQERVNQNARKLHAEVAELTRYWRDKGKKTAVLGGDHSSPQGHISACLERHPGAGILHVDAHHDLRKAYEGFECSHASIMYNILQNCPNLAQLVSVGIRDYCQEEYELARDHEKVTTFYDAHLSRGLMAGKTWAAWCEEILAPLPDEVYISFDIDGMQPALCPNTGTPVPGGLDIAQTHFLLEQLVVSGRSIIGFDLCEVAPASDGSDWDLNVGARLLWKLALLTLKGEHYKP